MPRRDPPTDATGAAVRAGDPSCLRGLLNATIGWLVAAEFVLLLTLKQLILPDFRQMLFVLRVADCTLLGLLAGVALGLCLRDGRPDGALPRIARNLYIVALLAMIAHPLMGLMEFTPMERATLLSFGLADSTTHFPATSQALVALHKRFGDLILLLLGARGCVVAADYLRRGVPMIEWVGPARSNSGLVNRVPIIVQLALVFGAILALTTATGLYDARQFLELNLDRARFGQSTRLPANQMREIWPQLQVLATNSQSSAGPPGQLAAVDRVQALMNRVGPLGTPEANAALAASRADMARARREPAQALPAAERHLKLALDLQVKVVEHWGDAVRLTYARDHDLIILALSPAVTLAGILAFLLARSILTAVARARAMVRSVAESDDDGDVIIEGRGEFAMLMRDIVRMRQLVRQREQASTARQLRQREELADLDRRQRDAEAAVHIEATARRQAEAISQAKSEFLANVSHEIRTPLNGVLGMAQAMAGEPLSDAQRERLEVVTASGETLLSLLNDLLDISKIEAGKLDMESQPFEPAKAILAACAAFRTMAAEKDLGFRLELDEAIGTCRGDATRLGQVVANLASNAVKFTERGEIAVEARRGGDDVTIIVRDTGVGMAADGVERMFEKFVQADASTTRRFGGSGLGLAICRDLV